MRVHRISPSSRFLFASRLLKKKKKVVCSNKLFYMNMMQFSKLERGRDTVDGYSSDVTKSRF